MSLDNTQNILVSKNDIRTLNKLCRRRWIIVYTLENVDIKLHKLKCVSLYSSDDVPPTIEASLLKMHRFVEYFPENSFDTFVQSVVNLRRKGDKILDSSAVTEAMRLPKALIFTRLKTAADTL